jgi:hypothetical protein
VKALNPNDAVIADGRSEANAAATEALSDALRPQSAQLQTMVDAYADLNHAAAELLRAKAQPLARRVCLPPVSVRLRGFVAQLANKATATIALLTGEQRGRLAALVPGFTRAAFANEPEVIAMVMSWLDLAPHELARVLVASLGDLERRFAS